MPDTRLTREERRALTRRALLDAAAEVIATRGLHEASLDLIAEAAGFSKGAVYSNFDGKEDLLFAVMEEHNAAQLQVFGDLLAEPTTDSPAGSLDDALARVVTVLTESLSPDRTRSLLDTELWLYAQRHETARERLADFQRRHLAAIGQIITESAAAAGWHLGIPAHELGALLSAATRGIEQLAAVDPELGHDRMVAQLFAGLTEAIVTT